MAKPFRTLYVPQSQPPLISTRKTVLHKKDKGSQRVARFECQRAQRGLFSNIGAVGPGQVQRPGSLHAGAISASRSVLRRSRTVMAARICSRGDLPLRPQLYAFARLMPCRARNTVRSPALTSPDTVHSRAATLIGSKRSADQKVSSPIRC